MDIPCAPPFLLCPLAVPPYGVSSCGASAADSGNVPVVDMTEQMPSNYKGLHEWITEIIDQMQATQKK